MSERNYGESAFPHDGAVDCNGKRVRKQSDGMELRDYFAAKAMQGIMAGGSDFVGYLELEDWSGVAKASYAVADAMLREREK